MFSKLEPLEKSKHQELRLSKTAKFEFAKSMPSVALSFSEIQQASQYYPIIFPTDGPCIPMALFSLKENENKFIDDQYNWIVPYVPLQLKLYPFVLAKIDNSKDQFALCIDPDAEHFATGQGDPLFTANGEITDFVQGISKTLQAYQEELITTQALFTDIAEKGLIVPKKIDFQINGESKSFGGFNGVDMEKLVTMDDEIIAGLVKNGGMQIIYNHLQSLSNIAFLAQMTSKK